MTVRELVEQLAELNLPDAVVGFPDIVCGCPGDCYTDAHEVTVSTDRRAVILK